MSQDISPKRIETSDMIVSNSVMTSPIKRVVKKIKFHVYNSEINCTKLGKEHKYVNRGTYDKCTKCGSSRTHRISKKAKQPNGSA